MIKIKFRNENETEIKWEDNNIFKYIYQRKFKYLILLYKYIKKYNNKLIFLDNKLIDNNILKENIILNILKLNNLDDNLMNNISINYIDMIFFIND